MIEADIKQHAIDMFPEECVGYVHENTYHRLDNISNKPKERYQLSIKDKLMLFKLCKNLTALVHSHPTMNNNPSDADLGAQKATCFCFWIIGTDGINTTKIKEINL